MSLLIPRELFRTFIALFYYNLFIFHDTTLENLKGSVSVNVDHMARHNEATSASITLLPTIFSRSSGRKRDNRNTVDQVHKKYSYKTTYETLEH